MRSADFRRRSGFAAEESVAAVDASQPPPAEASVSTEPVALLLNPLASKYFRVSRQLFGS
jgi:hypothetical protein